MRILDFATVRILPLFEDYCAFIHESLAKGSVLVHCMAGAGCRRSPLTLDNAAPMTPLTHGLVGKPTGLGVLSSR